MASTIEKIKQLREETAAGMMDVKRALEESDGDMERARRVLRERGQAIAAKKSGRETNQGLIEAYIHFNGRVGVLVEVNCETDFVARTPEFRELAHDLAMQVAATSPSYVSIDEVPSEAWENLEKEHGDRDKAAAAVVLLEQPFIKDPKLTIRDLVRERIGKLGENIVVRRFARFEVGTANSAEPEE